jgi:hypothetical protein
MDFILRPLLQTSEKQSHMRIQFDQEYVEIVRLERRSVDGIRTVVDGEGLIRRQCWVGVLIPPIAQQTHVAYTKIQKMARHSNKPFGYFNQTTWKFSDVEIVRLERRSVDGIRTVVDGEGLIRRQCWVGDFILRPLLQTSEKQSHMRIQFDQEYEQVCRAPHSYS